MDLPTSISMVKAAKRGWFEQMIAWSIFEDSDTCMLFGKGSEMWDRF